MILVPTVSIGNVPQLAFDLLIHTYGLLLEKTLDDEYMYPIAGPQDYAKERRQGISTPIQVFSGSGLRLVQLRSPPLPNCQAKFLNLLQAELPGPFLIVGSANAGMRTNVDSSQLVWCNTDSVPQEAYESGYFKAALVQYSAEGLLNYIYEGDNIQNAIEVANALVEKLGLEKKPFVRPESWKKVYGNDAPTSLEDGIYA